MTYHQSTDAASSTVKQATSSLAALLYGTGYLLGLLLRLLITIAVLLYRQAFGQAVPNSPTTGMKHKNPPKRAVQSHKAMFVEMQRVPAFVRKTGVTTHQWYAQHAKQVVQPAVTPDAADVVEVDAVDLATAHLESDALLEGLMHMEPPEPPAGIDW